MRLRHLNQVAGVSVLLYLLCPALGHSQSTKTRVRWIAKAPSKWPPIAMVNQIVYSDTSYAVAGCAFLLDTGDEILAATAKHVLRYFRSESMSTVSFRGTLGTWKMFPKDAPSSITVVDKLINENDNESLEHIPPRKDWLLFTVREYPDNMQPLRLRSTPLESGQAVFIIGWRYTDEGSQKIYRGSCVESDDGSILISTEGLTNNRIPGLSGAPVIDADGYVVGLMSSKAGKMERLASVDYPSALIRKRGLSGIEYSTPIVKRSAPPKMRDAMCPREPSVCAEQMTEHFRKRGWVGITPDIDPGTGVISVTRVFSDSPAQRAGLRAGDIIQGLNGIKYSKIKNEDFMRAYDSFRLGDSVVFNVERGGRQLDIEVHLEKIPEAILEQWVNEHLLEYHRSEAGPE
jgi:hypothetical protein